MTGCELVIVAALSLGTPRQPEPRTRLLRRAVCLHTLIQRARREHAVIVDFRDGKHGYILTSRNV
jgi:hypothetical protein